MVRTSLAVTHAFPDQHTGLIYLCSTQSTVPNSFNEADKLKAMAPNDTAYKQWSCANCVKISSPQQFEQAGTAPHSAQSTELVWILDFKQILLLLL